ncbi:autoimmune regulator isoform X4 [Camelus ferus]|uniref:Autoimmune regulator isoform X4 n=1 Tax=Camelus ferus TaxID=419612 RepID=A0A8B8U714_CAMFR|nr:autoimmune regulator isoform X4 [Camelus ferus]
MAGEARAGGDAALRRLLRLHRTEIAVAVDSAFPLLHALADHDVVPEDKFQGPQAKGMDIGAQVSSRSHSGGGRKRDAREGQGRDLIPTIASGDTAFEREGGLPTGLPRAPLMAPDPGCGSHPGFLEGSFQGLQPGEICPAAAHPRQLPQRESVLHALQMWTSASPGRGGSTRPAPRPLHCCLGPPARGRPWKNHGQPRQQPCPRGAPPVQAPKPRPSQPRSWRAARSHSASHWATEFRPCPPQSREPWLCRLGTSREPAAPWRASSSSRCLSQNEDECAACRDGGELICCDGCPRAFHLACLSPPLREVPSGTWRCSSCLHGTAQQDLPRTEEPRPQEPPAATQVLLGLRSAGEEARGLPREPPDGVDTAVTYKHVLVPPSAAPLPLLDPSALRPLLCVGPEEQQGAVPGARCGVCLDGADTLRCAQCAAAFHWRCHFPASVARPGAALRCRSCSGDLAQALAPAEGASAASPAPSPARPVPGTPKLSDAAGPGAQAGDDPAGHEPVLHRDDLESLLSEHSFDGILQWAIQSMARPLAEAPTFPS